jgi:hypothetical protein
VPSTVIRNFRYHAREQKLEVVFVSGRHYFYHDVPAEIFEAMKSAPSKGTFFNAYIRNRFATHAQDETEPE